MEWHGAVTESLLIITSSIRAGKTAVLAEASDILRLRQWPNSDVMYGHLQFISKNYSSRAARRFLVARAMEDRIERELCRGVVSATNTIVCRLAASIETMPQRVKMRESGVSQRECVARVAELNVILDRARSEDLAVASEDRSWTEVRHQCFLEPDGFQTDTLPGRRKVCELRRSRGGRGWGA